MCQLRNPLLEAMSWPRQEEEEDAPRSGDGTGDAPTVWALCGCWGAEASRVFRLEKCLVACGWAVSLAEVLWCKSCPSVDAEQCLTCGDFCFLVAIERGRGPEGP